MDVRPKGQRKEGQSQGKGKRHAENIYGMKQTKVERADGNRGCERS